jgi:hypothetical protein
VYITHQKKTRNKSNKKKDQIKEIYKSSNLILFVACLTVYKLWNDAINSTITIMVPSFVLPPVREMALGAVWTEIG